VPGKAIKGKNKHAYFLPERLPNCPDENSSGRLHSRTFKRSLIALCPLCPLPAAPAP